MSASKIVYTAAPMAGLEPSEPISAEGLEAALAAVYELWGGRQYKAATVRPALSIGSGAAILAVEAGRVVLSRDEAATAEVRSAELEAVRAKEQRRAFRVKYILVRSTDHGAEPVLEREITVGDLESVFMAADKTVADALGGHSEATSYSEYRRRVTGVRTQISRAKAKGQEATTVRFPPNDIDGGFFTLPNRPSERYSLIAQIFTAEPSSEPEPEISIRRK